MSEPLQAKSEGAARIRSITEAVLLMVHGIPDDEMEGATAYLASMSTTNCWCVEYALRDGLLQLVKDDIEWRARAAAARSTGTDTPTEGDAHE